MSEAAPRFALLCYGPGVDLSLHRAWLAADGIDCRPLDEDGLGGLPRRVPVIYLPRVSWWAAQSVAQRTAVLGRMDHPAAATLLAGCPGEEVPADLENHQLAGWLDLPIGKPALRAALRAALRTIKLRGDLAASQHQVQWQAESMGRLHRIGIALSAERDMDALQHRILSTSRELTAADGGTLYLVEEGHDGAKVLAFHVFQNDSVPPPSIRMVKPISRNWLAGYVAATGQVLRIDDVYCLGAEADYRFDPANDRQLGYRTCSMLVVPMRNHEDEVVGVIQLINRKRHPEVRLHDEATVEREVIPFTAADEELLSSFASQAAVALDNKRLLDNIQALFKGFITASVKAIEQRDPATSGHSARVAQLTVALAHTINEVEVGRWRDVRFSPEQLKEIEYAALLHDFGKIGVREQVLVKAKKLYEGQLNAVRDRFRYAAKAVELRYAERKLAILLAEGREAYLLQEALLEAKCRAELAALEDGVKLVLAANEPAVLVTDDASEALRELARRVVELPDGQVVPLLGDDELGSLAVRKGSLTRAEREQINLHVTHSYNFLIQIPWTRDLKGVPTIAYAHHEWLNGGGYPRALRGAEIPIQATMMTVADIFDALAAQDRPYKRAVPVPRALEILGYEARDGHIDPALVDLFIRREVYRVLDSAAPALPAIAAGR